MKSYKSKLISFLLISICSLIIIANCTKKEQQETIIAEESVIFDSTAIVQTQSMLDGQTQIEEYVNSLMKIIKEKEQELKAKEDQLKQKSTSLSAKEKQLSVIEEELRQYRKISFAVFLFGILCLIIAFVFVFRKNKNNDGTESLPFPKKTEKLKVNKKGEISNKAK